MSARRRGPTPDMLLLRARLAGSRSQPRPDEPELPVLTADEDALIATEPPRTDEEGSLLLRRPIADVHLGHIGWSGAIDHAALQASIACAPATTAAVPEWLGRLGLDRFAWLGESSGETEGADALEVRLSRADLAVAQGLSQTKDAAAVSALASALVLPERIAGSGDATRAVLSDALHAYRHACLAHAWAQRLRLSRAEIFERDRDESAFALLSTLRAVLGER